MLRNVVNTLALSLILGIACTSAVHADDELENNPTPVAAEQGFPMPEETKANNVLSDHDEDTSEEEKISSDSHVFSFEDDEDEDDFE